METMNTPNSPTRNPSRPIYNRSRSQHGPESFTPLSGMTLSGKRSLGNGLSIARSFDEVFTSTTNNTSTGLESTKENGEVKGSGAGTGSGSSKQGGKHFSSTTVSRASGKKNSHSRGDIEFWASLYAQHKVYTRQVSKTAPESTNLNSQSPPSSNGSNYNHDDKINNRAPIKIWQVLTKTELEHYHDPNTTKSKSSKKHHETFQFERLPIKAPTASTATAAALSSNGRPFSIVFFFTIETLGNSASAMSKDSKSKKSKKSKSSSQETPTTLWYLETAYTRHSTIHDHMELMGDFISNGSNPTNGREVTPIYIYETEKLSFEQPKDQDAPVVLDLKLQSPEGVVYAEFSYTFIKDAKPENVHISSLRTDGSTRKSRSKSKSGKSRSALTSNSSKSELDSPLKNSFGRDTDSDDDSLVEIPDIKDLPMDVVAEEPDAGEHLMQATTQFFSKMGYWLYNSKVVQYIARDERVRTKTGFPADDIWMLGVCYQFAQEFKVEEKTLLFATDALDDDKAMENKKGKSLQNTQDSSPKPIPSTASDPKLSTPSTEEPANVQSSNSQTSISSGSVKSESTSRRRRYARAMSFSQFAGNNPERSAPTSSVSIQEARSHSHSRSASTNTSSSILEDDYDIKSASGNRTRTLSHSAELVSRSSSGSLSSNPKSTTTTISTKLSNMSISLKNDGSSQSEDKSVGGMATTAENRKDIQEQPAPGRKSGKRRMTISELFSWDSNSPSSTGKRNSTGSNGNNSSSISALKNLVGTGKGTGESNSKQKPPPVPPVPTTVQIDAADTESTSTPVSDVARQDKSDILQPSAITDESLGDNNKRERRRKTSNAVANPNSQSSKAQDVPSSHPTSYGDGIILAPNPAPQHVGRDYIPRTSSPLSSSNRSGSFSAKRQSSMPVSPVNSKPQKSIDSVASPSPPQSPLLLASPHSPSSSLKRSWRSLSLSLASTAKSALPLGLGSPGRTRTSLFTDGQKKNHGAGFGHDYDEDFDMVNQDNVPNCTLISLPPAIITAMSLQRPPPPWSSVAFKSLSHEQEVLRQFLMDFQSRLWFTYRKDLARIEPSFYTCDSGWGCMMRTGQSLLAQAFVQVLLGREWRAHHTQTQHSRRRYGEILSWFVDEPDRPYSIHRIAKAGLALDKRIGEWFGPSTVAHAMKRLTQSHTDCPIAVLVPMENNVCVSTIVQAATLSQESVKSPMAITSWRPVLLLMPTRYGLEKLTERYVPNLKQLFKMPQFLGIAGGRPGRSLYFVSCQGDELYYFDPHFVKPRVTTEEVESCPAPSFHCTVVRSMGITELDPSMLLGFLIESPSDLQELMKSLVGPDMDKSYPLLSIQKDFDIGQCLGTKEDTPEVVNEPEQKSTIFQEESRQVLSSSPNQMMTHELENHDVFPGSDSDNQFSIKSFDSTDEDEDDDVEDEDEETALEESEDEGVLI